MNAESAQNLYLCVEKRATTAPVDLRKPQVGQLQQHLQLQLLQIEVSYHNSFTFILNRGSCMFNLHAH